MWEKLSELEDRYNKVSEMLSDPEVLSSPERIRDLGREHSELREIMGIYGRYKKVSSELEQNRELTEADDRELAELAGQEIPALEEELEELESRIKLLLVPKDPIDEKDIILEVRAGTGGDEAGLFAKELYEMYEKYAARKGWKTEMLSASWSGQGGIKEIITQISGKNVFGNLRYESGVHRVQRVPVTESQGRIHTSAVTVAVLPQADEVEMEINEAELKIDVFRSSGPGGQSVNTTDSAVRITHLPTGLVVVCQDERSQHKNKAKAMKILRSRLLDMERQRQQDERASMRKNMVGSGDRSEKIRTYNFPQGRVTDHRIGLTLYKLERVMEGELDEFVEALSSHDRSAQLEHLEANAS